jgi:DNA polymerase-3 subunit delta'
MSAPFPWQEAQWCTLKQACLADRLPHALLLSGGSGSGVVEFSRHWVAYLLCEETATRQGREGPCGQCRSCVLFQAGNHPEYLAVAPEGDSRQIKIDQIRELNQFVSLKSHYGRPNIVAISPAEAMNRNAANSLLKTLEEPPSDTLILLVSFQPMGLPITVRSRCQRVDFRNPDKEQVHGWLAEQTTAGEVNLEMLLTLANDEPLAALRMLQQDSLSNRRVIFEDLVGLVTNSAEDPIETAERWAKLGETEVTHWVSILLQDTIKLCCLGQQARLINQDLASGLEKISKLLGIKRLFQILDLLHELRRLNTGQSQLAPQSILEELALCWK